MVYEINIEDIESVEEIVLNEIYDLTVEDNHNYYLDCGYPILVHNSGKSFAAYQLIYTLCCQNNHDRARDKNVEPLSCYVVRKTLKSARETAFKEDFKTLLRAMHDFQEKCVTGENQSPVYDCYGSTIKFIGMDGEEELGKSDIVFYNEILDEDNEERFEDMILRCQKLVIADWNPKFTYHWVFRWEGRFNTLFTKTTFWDNKFCPPQFKAEIMSRCPYDFSDWDFEKREWKTKDETLRPINQLNEKNGTINKRRWLIYGEGQQCPEAGAIYQNYEWVDEFPESGFDEVALSIDFGFTNDPTVLGRTGRVGKELWDECLSYEPTPTPQNCFDLVSVGLEVEEARRKKEYEKQGLAYNGNLFIWCDSSDKDRDDEEYVLRLNEIARANKKKWNFIKTSKIGIRLGIDIVQSYKLNFVKNPNVKMELENYVWKIVEGRVTNIPIDKLNHNLDRLRYNCVDGITDRKNRTAVDE
ncbi:MAG: hypothetical protein ACRCV7_00075 [Culicoidibacterales bacterium]